MRMKFRGEPEIAEAKTLQEAVDIAAARAVAGDIVTLSPACAAFDQFANFMERGRVFKQMVNALPE